MSEPTTNMEKARDYLRRWELRPYWRKQKRMQRAFTKALGSGTVRCEAIDFVGPNWGSWKHCERRAIYEAFSWGLYSLCGKHARTLTKDSRVKVVLRLKGGRVKKVKKAVKPKLEDVRVKLAKLLHESGREAVERRKIYRSDLPVLPFCEWGDLDDAAREGRILMAKFLLDKRRRATLQGIFATA